MQICLYPPVSSQEDANDLLARASWYFEGTPLRKLAIPRSGPWRMDAFERPESFDGSINRLFEGFAERTEIIDCPDRASLERLVGQDWRALFLWQESDAHHEFLARHAPDTRVRCVDRLSVRQEGSAWIAENNLMLPDRTDVVRTSRKRLAALAKSFVRPEKVTIFASGPSVENYRDFNFRDSIGIICNSVVMDDELLDQVRPNILCFGDPIFHFGPSRYAEKFRAKMVSAVKRHDLWVFVPLMYFGLLRLRVPEISDRLIPLPHRKDREFNLNLLNDPELKVTSNILTFLLLPIASTLGQRIELLGCDGRPLAENNYFWRFNPKTQINDQMDNIKAVHPAFFAIDYNDYYQEHCETVAQVIAMGEAAGRSFVSLTPSHIPALSHRFLPTIQTEGSSKREDFPRLLLLDSTCFGSLSATGQLKDRLFRDWPRERLLQIHSPLEGQHSVWTFGREPDLENRPLSEEELRCLLFDFSPEAVYFRPVDNRAALFEFGRRLLAETSLPYAVHIMDDWPERLRLSKPDEYARLSSDLQDLISTSDICLSIGDAMSQAFVKRYGRRFLPVANGVDLVEWCPVTKTRKEKEPMVVRYSGALSEDMTLHTLILVAEAIEELSREMPIRFEVFTMEVWRKKAEKAFASLQAVALAPVTESVESYRTLMATADLLIIGYNFDAESLAYIRYSVGNKFPEYLNAGKPLLVVGPREAATVALAESIEGVLTVTMPDPEAIKAAIRSVFVEPEQAVRRALDARGEGARRLGMDSQRRLLEENLCALKNAAQWSTVPLGREHRARIEEVELLAEVLLARKTRGVMIDVGAHYGSSLLPFARKGWRVFAFEPDPSNRRALTQKIATFSNATLDDRAVSDRDGAEVAFFTSQESTGISSLKAFHPSHKETARVRTVTLTRYCEEQNIEAIDFLKIDTEGFDLMVLKGLPWAKLQPEVIIAEFEDTKSIPLGYDFHEFAGYLLEKGYHVLISEWHPILRYGIRHEWRRLAKYPCELGDAKAWGNLLAFRNPILMQEVKEGVRSHVKMDSRKEAVPPGRPEAVSPEVTEVEPKGGDKRCPASVFEADPAKEAKVAATVLPEGKSKNPARPPQSPPPQTRTPDPRSRRFSVVRDWAFRLFYPLVAGLLAVSLALAAWALLAPATNHVDRWAIFLLALALLAISVGLGLDVDRFRRRIRKIRESQAAGHDQIQRRIASGRAAINRKTRQLLEEEKEEIFSRVAEQEALLKREIDSLNQRQRQFEDVLNKKMDWEKNELQSIGAALATLQHRVSLLDTIVQVSLSEPKQEQRESLLTKEKQIRIDLVERTVSKLNYLNQTSFQQFNRHLTSSDVALICKDWLPALKLDLDRTGLGYLAHKICLTEDLCDGRYATNVQDALLRVLVARSLLMETEAVRLLEIGTLFGINIAALRACNRGFGRFSATAIDPLMGYYAEGNLDLITRIPVNEEVFRHNMQFADVPEEAVDVVKFLSTQIEAIQAVSEKRFNLFIIDGDHSYGGVKFDFDHYHHLVDLGGFIVFDDFSSQEWPDVSAFVEKEVMPRHDLQLVGTAWRTAVFKKVLE